jgi:Tfp pilus assembly protein PilF
MELHNGNITTAKRLITEALTRDKRQGSGWLIASQIEERLGNDGLVGLILRRGIECAPTDVELYRALGEHMVKKGKINDVRYPYRAKSNVFQV